MIDTAALKNSILDLAFQGKLTSQDSSDGSAEDLYNEICDEKSELIKLGKIKKNKIIPIKDEDIPYSIPDNWKWIRWGDLSEKIQYGYNAPAKSEGRIKMVRISDIQDNTVLWDTVPYCEIEEEQIADYLLRENDILFARTGGTVGKSYIVSDIPEDAVFAGYLIRTSYSNKLCSRYMKFFMESKLYWKQLRNGTIATAQPNCNGQTLSKMMVPLPPFTEQLRIVETVEKAFEQIDEIDILQVQYSSNLEVLKSKIIDAGIQGRLTEQLPEDGTADELLEQIREKKDQMIKDGLIPKESKSQIINDEDKSFETPKNWAYARVQDVATYITDYVANGSFATLKANTTTYKEPNYAVFVRTLDLGAEFKNDLSYIDEASYEFLKKSKLYGGELILPNIGASIGKAFIMPDLGMPMSLAPNSVMVKFENNVMNKYFYYVFQSSYGKGILMNIQGGAATPKFSKTDLRKMVVMLPPLAEQERIVNRIEEIFALI